MLITRSTPMNLKAEDEFLFKKEKEKDVFSFERQEVSDCFVYSNGFITLKSGRVSPLTFTCPGAGLKFKLKTWVRGKILKNKIVKTLEMDKALWVTDEFSNGYFHWIAEVLPKIADLSDEEQDFTLLIPAMARFPYTTETLKTWPNLKYIFIDARTRVSVKNLRIIKAKNIPGNYYPKEIQELRTVFRSTWVGTINTGKLYISRAKAARRKISNEADVRAAFERHGWTTVFLEDLPWIDQARLITGSKAVAGLHGAGLVNWVFLKEGTPVLEFRMEDDAHNNCYFSLASALNLPYYYQTCSPENPGQDIHLANLNADILKLEQVLTLMGERESI